MAQKTLRGQFVLHTAIQGKPIISAATAEIKFGAGYSEKTFIFYHQKLNLEQYKKKDYS